MNSRDAAIAEHEHRIEISENANQLFASGHLGYRDLTTGDDLTHEAVARNDAEIANRRRTIALLKDMPVHA